MKDVFYRARYMLALATNTMTDAIREEYLSTAEVDSALKAQAVLAKMVEALSKHDTLTADEEKRCIAQEYEALGLTTYLGSYSLYSTFFEGLVDIRRTTYTCPRWLDMLKDVKRCGDTLPDEFRLPVYNAILANLVRRNLLITDTEYASSIVDYIHSKGADSSEYIEFARFIESAVMHFK